MARILIVDDELNLRCLLNRALARFGHEVAEASDGKEALKRLAKETFDLLVTDIIMPEVEGIDLILQSHRRFPNMPILAMTGGGRVRPDGYLRTAVLAGAKRALAKPFAIPEFVAAVGECLNSPKAEVVSSPQELKQA